jgi:hypothetical protein
VPSQPSSQRRSIGRRIAIGVLALVLAATAAAVGAVYWFLSGDGIRQALEQQATTWLGQPVRIESAAARFIPRPGITLRNVRVGEPATLTLATIAVSTDLRALLDRRIEQAEITVSDSRIQMPLPSMTATSATTTGDRPAIRLVSVRTIALDNVTLISRGREIVASAESALDGDTLTVRRFSARTPQTTLEAEGIVALAPRVDATVRAKANLLDVDELIALADAFTPDTTSGARAAGPSPRLAARISAEKARAGGVEVAQFAAEMTVDGSRVTLSPMTFQVFGGRYQGALTAQLGSTSQASPLQVTLRSRITGLDVAQLAAFGGVSGAMTGTLSGAGEFSGRGAEFGAVLQSARGNGTATIENGTIQRLDLIRTVVLFFGRPAPETAAATDAFERMDTTFALANQVFSATAFSLQSRDADIVGSGTLHVDSKALAGRLDLSLSEELSAQAGTDLQRYTLEGKRVVLPATLGGTLGQPRLRIDAKAAVTRGLRNEIQRRLGGLLDRITRPDPGGDDTTPQP